MHPFLKILILGVLVGGFFLCASLRAFAQQKVEEEYRLEVAKVPAKAQQFVTSIFPEARIKWYRERSLTSESVEAKFKQNGTHYSIEFDTLGQLQDVEMLIRGADIPERASANIATTLTERYKKYKIERLQRQLTGDPDAIRRKLKDEAVENAITIRYELVVNGKTEAGRFLFEHLFDTQGNLLQTAQIITRNTDILNY